MLDVVIGVVDDSVIVSVCFLPAHYVWSLVDCVGVHVVGGLNVLSIDVVGNYGEACREMICCLVTGAGGLGALLSLVTDRKSVV